MSPLFTPSVSPFPFHFLVLGFFFQTLKSIPAHAVSVPSFLHSIPYLGPYTVDVVGSPPQEPPSFSFPRLLMGKIALVCSLAPF